MALHEHPTLCYQPTSTTIRLVSSFIILYHCNLYVQLLWTWYSDSPAVSSEQRIPIILLLYDRRSTRGTRKYSKVYPVYQTHVVGMMSDALFRQEFVCVFKQPNGGRWPQPLRRVKYLTRGSKSCKLHGMCRTGRQLAELITLPKGYSRYVVRPSDMSCAYKPGYTC